MPQYKDDDRGTWYCKFGYQDWTGQRRQKLKRGFSTKREAAAWEREFLEKQQGTPDMTFSALYNLYLEDIKQRLKAGTVRGRKYRCDRNIIPYFGEKPINQILPADIRKWQNEMIQAGFKKTYLRALNEQLSIILNFAVKYYKLPSNPCRTAGTIGKARADRMEFWTLEEFQKFIQYVKKPEFQAAFTTLYYTGLRSGELLALTRNDIDFEAKTLTVLKTYDRVGGKDVITSPKTENSNRCVTISPFLVDSLSDYTSRIYGIQPGDRVFPFTRDRLARALRNACKESGIRKIRLHDIRHSHVSLLIDLGFTPMLIAERIGDTVDMVNNIYGHLYPNRHRDVADRLQQIVSK